MIMICAVDNTYRAEQVMAKPTRAYSGYSWTGAYNDENSFLTFPSELPVGNFNLARRSAVAIRCYRSCPH